MDVSRLTRIWAAAVVVVLLVAMLSGGGPEGIPTAGGSQSGGGRGVEVSMTGCGAVGGQAVAAPAKTVAYRQTVGPLAAGGRVARVAYEGARVDVGPGALAADTTIGITPLGATELPRLDQGMTNVTPGSLRGYRFTPHPFSFRRPVQVAIPYDPALVGASFDPQDVYTYFFEERTGCWRQLERLAVDQRNHVVVSRTDHFTDMINAVVTVPDHPDNTSFDPTQIKNIAAGDPGAGVNLVAAPGASSTGEARLSYPFETPPGRGGLHPQVALQYSSTGGDGWVGVGWDMSVPSIAVDTRWGVPRYDGGLETETYQMGSDQLTPVANRGALASRTAEKVFHPRVESAFDRIVRHGTTPANYSWETVDKAGAHSIYGGTPDSTLTDDAGNVFEWALREVRDAHGNVVRYHTVRQSDIGVAGGSVPGTNLYLQKITYAGTGTAEGPYAVTFIRDRELDEARRPDVTIDARGGFKRVTADLLRRVEVTLDNLPIRGYELNYTTGAFGKTLLKSVTQLGDDGRPFTTHAFDYFDDIRDGAGAYQAFSRLSWVSPADELNNGAVNAVSGGAGEAGAINANTSTSAGGHLYVGFGALPTKSGSVGVKTGFSHAEDTGLLALIDVDGDNLPDKVFRSGGGVVYRKNLFRPGGQPRFSDQVTPLSNLPGILAESSDTLTVGVEGYLGGVAAQLDNVDTFTTTSRYFTDVNGDGIADLVDGGSVLFGRIGPGGAPVYGAAADTPFPIGSRPVDAGGVIGDFGAARERAIESHPLVDTVRRWVAPFDGTVAVTGTVRLVQDTGPQRAAYTKADGVRVAVQREDAELWSQQIGPADHTDHAPSGVDAVPVKRGDRLYFRVQSTNDGAFDQVAWDPQISYAGVPDVVDVNGRPAYRYGASADFTLGGRTTSLAATASGTLHLSGALTKKAATTDDVTVVITRDDVTVFERTMPAGQAGEVPVDLDIPVTQGQKLRWRVRVDSPIDLGQIQWTPKAEYPSGQVVQPPYDVDMYPEDGLTAPQGSYVAPSAGTLTVDPALALGDQAPDGRVVFTVKRRGSLLAKKVIGISNGQIPPDLRLAVPVDAGDELFFDFSVLDRALAAKVTEQSVRVGLDPGDLAPAPSALHSAAAEGAFPQPYRGWGLAGYNGNRDRSGRPIVQGDLVVDAGYKGQLPGTVDPVAQRDAFAADPKVTPPKVFAFAAAPARQRWEIGDLSWGTGGGSSSSRLGAPAITIPAAGDFANVTAVPRLARSNQISLTGGIGGGVITIGGSIASGSSTGQLDYLDMNGDGFPDIVGAGGIQYTDPTGQLGTVRGALPEGSVRETSTESGNASAGSAGRTITTGRGYPAPPAYSQADTAEAGNDLPPLGVGGSLGSGSSDGKFDLVDINGDNLPDRVYADGRAALNLGYRFAAPEPWPGGTLNTGTSESSGLNIGFNLDFYGLAGGASFSRGRGSIKSSLIDINGDGLADRVFEGNPIRVALNTGSGFAAPQPFFGSMAGVNADANAKVGAGGYATFPACVAIFAGCVITNPGADTSTGVSRSEQALRDVTGDGYVDQLQSTSDNQLAVAENTTGRTNLLKSVRRPLGSRIDVDYTRDGNTYDLPQSRWVMSRVAVNDGHPGDGQDVQLTTYQYEGGRYNRLEREFLGYGAVVAQTRDPGAGEAVYRTDTTEYRNDSHYTHGLVAREVTADAAGHPFRETVNTYQLRDVLNPGAVADPDSATASIFTQLVRTDRSWFEGQATAGKSTYIETAYDDVGNPVRVFDAGDAGTADDVETKVRYTVEDPACRVTGVVGTAKLVDVRGNGALMRHREATVDCATGNVVQQRSMLADGTAAVTDMGYFANGNLKSVTGPPNKKGQRYRLDYAYDPATNTYLTSTTDSFGYHSSASYNLRYGTVETTTDINNQQTRNVYDSNGRVDYVVGPYETASNHPTIDFEYHPEAAIPYAVTRNIDHNSDGGIRTDSIDTVTFTDGLGRVVQTKKDAAVSGGPGAAPVDSMIVSGHNDFDFVGRVAQQFYPTTEPKGPLNTRFTTATDTVQPTRTAFDVLDRTTGTVLPDGTTTTTAYGFAADRSGATQFETAVTDANGNVRRVYFDAQQRTTAVKQANPAGGQPTIWTSYAYNPLGELTKVVDDHNNLTTSTYDNFGRRTSFASPDAGRTSTTYDLAGNTTTEVTANLADRHDISKQEAIEYDYDFNRLAAIRYPNFDENDVTYKYGAPGAAAGGANRIVAVTDGAGTSQREYGPLGEVTKQTRTVAGTAYATSYRYDTFNRVLQMTYPDGETLSYHYNSGGLVDGATGVKGSFTYPYVTRLDYDKFDQRVLLDTGNGTRTAYTYDANSRRLATLRGTLSDGSTFENNSYGYDGVGNITAIGNSATADGSPAPPPLLSLAAVTTQATTDAASMVGPTTQSFTYDGLNRLVGAQGQYQPAPDTTNSYQFTMAYDSINNVTAKNQQNQITTAGTTVVQPGTSYDNAYAYKAGQPHAPSTVGATVMKYDANGNLISRTEPGKSGKRRQLVWDDANRLACVRDGSNLSETVSQDDSSCRDDHAVRFAYDDKGQRVVKDAGSNDLTVYPDMTYSKHNKTAFKHVFIGGTRLVSQLVMPSGQETNQFYFHPDQVGSTGYGTDAAGRLVEHLQYFPSGETWVDQHTGDGTPYQFTGKELDAETGLYYYGARYYDPRTAIWQSPDPMLGAPPNANDSGVYDPTNLAAYTYARGNPVRLSDPTGAQVLGPNESFVSKTRFEELLASNGMLAGMSGGVTRNRAVGLYFEQIVRDSMGIGMNSRNFFSAARMARQLFTANPAWQVRPDNVGDIEYQDGKVHGFLIDSYFRESKAISEPITPEYRDNQVRGLIDAASNSAAGYTYGKYPPVLIFDTLRGNITDETIAYATSKGVALFQTKLVESWLTGDTAKMVRISEPVALNGLANQVLGEYQPNYLRGGAFVPLPGQPLVLHPPGDPDPDH